MPINSKAIVNIIKILEIDTAIIASVDIQERKKIITTKMDSYLEYISSNSELSVEAQSYFLRVLEKVELSSCFPLPRISFENEINYYAEKRDCKILKALAQNSKLASTFLYVLIICANSFTNTHLFRTSNEDSLSSPEAKKLLITIRKFVKDIQMQKDGLDRIFQYYNSRYSQMLWMT